MDEVCNADGACCFAEVGPSVNPFFPELCVEVTGIDCVQAGGKFFPCLKCPDIEKKCVADGACCLESGGCIQTSSLKCADLSGLNFSLKFTTHEFADCHKLYLVF